MVWVLVIKICECEHKWFGFEIVREILRWEHRVKLSSNSNSIPSISITALKIERTNYIVPLYPSKRHNMIKTITSERHMTLRPYSTVSFTNQVHECGYCIFHRYHVRSLFVNILQNFKKTFHWSQTTIKMSYQICTLKTTSSLVFQVETLSFHLLVHLSRQYI